MDSWLSQNKITLLKHMRIFGIDSQNNNIFEKENKNPAKHSFQVS